MRVHYLQHVPFEGLGSIETALQQRQASITVTRLYEQAPLPPQESFDLLIVMGGPMSINDEAIYPWLVAEKAFIRATIAADKPVLGICLGAQLIAGCCGGKVYPNADKEIGWFDIVPQPTDDPCTFAFAEPLPVFHWHGETFTLPAEARLLASSTACRHQAFQLAGKAVIGLQCHLETTPDSLRALVEHCGDELITAPYIQSKAALLATPASYFAPIHRQMNQVLDYLLSHAKQR